MNAVDVLAAYRLTRLVTTDKIMRRPRVALMSRGVTAIDCDWCVGVWVAFGVVAARRYAPAVWSPVATALALSALTGLAAEHTL